MSYETRTSSERTLREEARRAKSRIKSGFWLECKEDLGERLEKARRQGLNESKAERFFCVYFLCNSHKVKVEQGESKCGE